MLNHVGGAIIGTVSAVAGAVLGGGGANNEQDRQNDRHQVQGNGGPPNATSSSSDAPPNLDASVLNPAYVLTNSVSEQLGMNTNEAPQQEKEQSEEDLIVQQQDEEEEEDNSNEEKQALHPLFNTTADRMPYAPGQQPILGDSTLDRLQLPAAENTTRDGTTLVSEASGRGYSSGEESSPFLSSFKSSADDNFGGGTDASTLSPIIAANSTHIHRASIPSPNFELDERRNTGPNNEEPEQSTSVDGTGLGYNESSNIANSPNAEEEQFPAEDDSLLADSDTGGDTTKSVNVETDLETSTSTTRSGRKYASTSTIVRSTAKRKIAQEQTSQREATAKRRKASDQSQQASILSSDLTTPVFAVKAIYNKSTEKFTVKIQTVLNGPYLEASKKDIITIRKMGHGRTLEAVRQKALEKGESHSAISSGAKSEHGKPMKTDSATEDIELKPLGPVLMTATGKYCATDSITNMVHDVAVNIYSDDLGETLRSFCDGSDGKIDFKSLSAKVNDQTKKLRLELRRLKKLQCGTPFGNASPHLRQKAIIDLASTGKMLIVDYFSRRHSKARGHVVGVADGKVYDNDETTGGVFDLHAYASREWDGIYAVRIVVPH